MTADDLIFYIADVIILVMFIRMCLNSREVEVESKVGMKFKWIVPVLFILVAVITLVRYEGVFRIVETIVLLVFAGLYLTFRNGLSKKGIVLMGKLVPYTKAGIIHVSDYDNCIFYNNNKRKVALFFENEQLPEVRKYLSERSATTEKLNG